MASKSLVLIPGLACDRTAWSHQIKHLQDLDDEIIVPDLSIAGSTEAMLSAVMDVVPERFMLAGHSMGGWVALEVMRAHAHRVEKLCLLSTTSDVDSDEKRAARARYLAHHELGLYDDIVEDLLDLFVFREEKRDAVRQMLLSNEAAFPNQQRALMNRKSTKDVLKEISIPTLVLLGRDDVDFPIETQEIANMLPVGRLVWIEKCGHMLTMEQPEAVTALMSYWIEYM